jgi:hypothetical protein
LNQNWMLVWVRCLDSFQIASYCPSVAAIHWYAIWLCVTLWVALPILCPLPTVSFCHYPLQEWHWNHIVPHGESWRLQFLCIRHVCFTHFFHFLNRQVALCHCMKNHGINVPLVIPLFHLRYELKIPFLLYTTLFHRP